MYKTITRNQDRMDRLKFRDVLHNSFDMTDDILMDRGKNYLIKFKRNSWITCSIFIYLFLVFRAFDKDNDSYISMSEWVEGLSIFLRGSIEEKIKC